MFANGLFLIKLDLNLPFCSLPPLGAVFVFVSLTLRKWRLCKIVRWKQHCPSWMLIDVYKYATSVVEIVDKDAVFERKFAVIATNDEPF
jgi:hypothetical protein